MTNGLFSSCWAGRRFLSPIKTAACTPFVVRDGIRLLEAAVSTSLIPMDSRYILNH